MFENSVTYQFIGNVTKGGAAAEPTDILDLPEGAVALVNENNSVENDPTTGDRVRIVQKANGQFIYSPYFIVGDAEVNKYEYSAETQQVTYLGLDGDDNGKLDDEQYATYTLGVVLMHTAGVANTSPMIKTIPAYNKTGTQYNLAETLIKSFNRLMKEENRQPIKAEMIYNGDTTDADSGATLTVVKGSYSVEASTAPTDGLPTAGDYIFITTDGDDTAYKVTEVNDDVYTLEIPYAGESETIANGSWGTIDDEDTGDFGIRFTGIAIEPEKFDAVTETHRPVEFKLSWDRIDAPATADPDSTTITYDTSAIAGRGTYMEIAGREVYATMNEGNPFISSYPPTKYRGMADPDNTYNVYVINATDKGYTSPTTGQNPISMYNMYVAVDEDLGDDETFWDRLT